MGKYLKVLLILLAKIGMGFAEDDSGDGLNLAPTFGETTSSSSSQELMDDLFAFDLVSGPRASGSPWPSGSSKQSSSSSSHGHSSEEGECPPCNPCYPPDPYSEIPPLPHRVGNALAVGACYSGGKRIWESGSIQKFGGSQNNNWFFHLHTGEKSNPPVLLTGDCVIQIYRQSSPNFPNA